MRAVALSVALLLSGPAAGELCPPLPDRPAVAQETDGRTRLSARHLSSVDGEVTEVRGEALLTRDSTVVGADYMRIEQRGERAVLEGDVAYYSPDYRLHSERAELALDTDVGLFTDARFLQDSNRLQGQAQRIEQSPSRTVLEQATFSTCPPGEEAWRLDAGRVTLDHQARQGTAYNTVLYFQSVPIFYSPWFRFPLGNDRQSGFLAPAIGVSNTHGTEIELPFYWNIAPQADATLTARHLSKRGTQVRTEGRLLTGQGRWQLDTEYLDDEVFGDTRHFTALTHSGRLGSRWTTSINTASASDEDYFDDLGNSLSIASVTHLERRADLTWFGSIGSFNARVQNYQTLDEDIAPGSRPYERLPSLSFAAAPVAAGAFDFGFTAEAVRFEREDSLTGERLNLRPRVAWPSSGPAWFFEPAVELHQTHYRLDNPTPGERADLERSVPLLSLDTGLFFERDLGGRLQTLEPRLFYLHAPFEEQDDFPLFDSGEYTFGFDQLFRTNRFTGADRVGDADQVSAALTTRVLDPARGVETLRASIGQIFYLRDREVTLPGGEPDTRASSDIIAESALEASERWSLNASLQYNPQERRNDKGSLGTQYRGFGGDVTNFAYRYRRDEQQQLDWSFRWPLNPSWRVVGRWNHSILDNRMLEALAGFEYENCCWMFRGVSSERVIDDGEDIEQRLYLQLVLKGLTDIGQRADALLERAILGYR